MADAFSLSNAVEDSKRLTNIILDLMNSLLERYGVQYRRSEEYDAAISHDNAFAAEQQQCIMLYPNSMQRLGRGAYTL